MSLPKGTKRYQHVTTKEIRYFRNAPNPEVWNKVGTPGSKLWKWITNGSNEQYISSATPIPEGYTCGRLKN